MMERMETPDWWNTRRIWSVGFTCIDASPLWESFQQGALRSHNKARARLGYIRGPEGTPGFAGHGEHAAWPTEGASRQKRPRSLARFPFYHRDGKA